MAEQQKTDEKAQAKTKPVKAQKPKKPKKTKEEKAAARKQFRDYWKWRIALSFKGVNGWISEMESAVDNEDRKKLNAILKNSEFKRKLGERKQKQLIVTAWETVISKGKTSLYDFLLNHSCDPSVKDRNSRYGNKSKPGEYMTAYAVAYGNRPILEAMQQAGVDMNFEWHNYDWHMRDTRGIPLDNAVKRHDTEFVSVLLEGGAKAGYRHVAVLVGNLAKGRGVENGHDCLDVILAKKPKLDLEDGALLRTAAEGRDTKTFEKLLDAGADLELSYRYTQSGTAEAEFMRAYVEKSRTGWHLAGDDVVIKISYAPDSDTRIREVFNFGSEIVSTEINDNAPAQLPFNQVAQKQIQKAKAAQAKLLKKPEQAQQTQAPLPASSSAKKSR
ncbi:MAG: ankyrin repeat domain-containing protein [Alphaproteobacteria bacterium]|nr:MAG: ankyrin repeat domain-containing protein [Alphaproteobacteria bacterium]